LTNKKFFHHHYIKNHPIATPQASYSFVLRPINYLMKLTLKQASLVTAQNSTYLDNKTFANKILFDPKFWEKFKGKIKNFQYQPSVIFNHFDSNRVEPCSFVNQLETIRANPNQANSLSFLH
jgi:hypothetical protein